jgi:hypothetical protein
MLILRGGGTTLLGPIIGAFPDTASGDVARDLAECLPLVEGWPVLAMAVALPTLSSAIPRPRFVRPRFIRRGFNPHAPTAEVSPHG